MDKPIFSGTLSVLPIGWKQVLKKTWQEKYCLLYKASKSGIDRLEIFDNAEQDSVPRIITLESCIKIEKKSTTVFSVITKANMHDFMATNEDALEQWIRMMQQVAFKDFNNEETASICEDNELYCPSEEKSEFKVTLHMTEASNRCKLEGKQMYLLVLTSSAIQLFAQGKTATKDDRVLLFTWPYCYVRRYGHKDGKFTFEAGRKCDSGEGMFLFEHDNQQEIFRCVSSKMKSMKKMLKESISNNNSIGSSTSSCHSSKGIETELLNCGENQLQAAMIMEAGSRSPLPPSPTTSTTLQDVDSINSNSMLTSVGYSTRKDQQSNNSPERGIIKDIPKKPPRKNISNTKVDDRNSHLNYETIGNYDEVEKRENAWKTLGTVDVRHSDHVNEDSTMMPTSEVEYLQSRTIRSKQTINTIDKPSNSGGKVIYARESPTDDNVYNTYDHLSFFGSTSKLCSTPSNGYKQVIPVQINQTSMSSASKESLKQNSNDYDEVGVSTVNLGMNTVGVGQMGIGEVSLEEIRLADDSHLGYAVVRKPVATKEKYNIDLEHRVYNDNPYAIISKPKHV